MSSHQTTTTHEKQKPLSANHQADNEQQVPALSPLTALDLQRASQRPDKVNPRQVLQLQRMIGNQATTHLLNNTAGPLGIPGLQRQVSSGGYGRMPVRQGLRPVVQRKLMTVKEFKAATYVRWSRRKKIEKIDDALKKVQQTGPDIINLSELKAAIEGWLKLPEFASPRRVAVLELRDQVEGDIDKIRETLSTTTEQTIEPQTRGRSNAMSAQVTGAGQTYGSDFSDFDSKQFRVSGRAPNRIIEEVKRTVKDGVVTYYSMGLVTGFNGKVPMIAPYPRPISLGDWYPQVTHINGMAVAPKSGLQSAAALQESINSAMGGSDDVAMGQDAIDVLYTYSAQRGNPLVDVWDCIKGKVEVRDEATERQEEIMLDAVHRGRRVTVSAHSRGTIKTDNAVMNVHKKLGEEFYPRMRALKMAEAVVFWTRNDPGIGIPPEALAEITIKNMAEDQAKKMMNRYIQLVYAGNAVQYPSSILPPRMFVGGLDPVSMFVGSYTSTIAGTKSVGAFKGHGFVGNYVPAVGQEIAQDIQNR